MFMVLLCASQAMLTATLQAGGSPWRVLALSCHSLAQVGIQQDTQWSCRPPHLWRLSGAPVMAAWTSLHFVPQAHGIGTLHKCVAHGEKK